MAPRANLRSTWRLLKPHAKPQLPLLLLVVFLGSATAFVQTASILLLEPLWELVIFTGDGTGESALEAVAPDLGTGDDGEPSFINARFIALRDGLVEERGAESGRLVVLYAVCGLLILGGLFTAFCQYSFVWLSRWVSLRMVVGLRMRLARHLVGLSLRYHGKRSLGDLLSRISADVQSTLTAVDTGLKRFVQEPAYVVFYIGLATYAAPLLSLVVLLSFPVLGLPVSQLSKRVRRRSTRSLASLGSSVQALAQLFQGIRTVKAFRAEERELERYRELNEEYVKSSMKLVRSIAMTRAWTNLFTLAGMGVLLLGAGWLAIRFEFFDNPGKMVMFFLAFTQLTSHIKYFVKALTSVDESVGAAVRLQHLLDEPVDVVQAEQPVRLQGLGDGIRFEGVEFSYPDTDEKALHGIDLEIRPGETLALVGPSGAGKSTLVDLVCRFFDPSQGVIRVDGHDLRQVSLDDWTALYATVGQVPFLFHASAAENIRYGRPGASDAEVEEAARAAGIHDYIASLPDGYETNVDDAGSRFSGGQRQRITIARALLKGAPLLLLDEATSALDSESEAAVQEALERLMENRTVIVIAHRLATIRGADRIAVLEAGRLVELGRHDELIDAGGTYARLCSLQQLGAPSPQA